MNYLRFLAQSWPLLAFGFVSVFWGNFGQSFFLSWFGAPIQASLGLSASEYGSLYSFATLGAGILMMLFGGMVDRWALRRFVTVAAAGLVLACVLLSLAASPFTLFLGFFLVRLCGQGFLPHSAQTSMARYFASNRGKALSISSSGVPLGEVILPTLAVFLIGLLGWRQSWLLIALSVVCVYLPLVYALLRAAPVDTATPPLKTTSSDVKHVGRRQVLADYRFWLALPTLLAGPFMITGIFIHQGFILAEKDWSASWLAICFVALGITHWISSLTAGILIDLFSARRLLPFTLAPLLAAMATLVLLDGQWAALPFMILLGMTVGAGSPIMGALWPEVYGTARLGSIRSLMASLMIFSTAASPILFGALIDQGLSLQEVFGGTGWALAIAFLMVLFSYKPDSRAAP